MQVAESGDPTEAAIASERAAHLHGLTVIAGDVGDHPEAYTRFVSISTYTRIDREAVRELGVAELLGWVKVDNAASLRAFERAGYARTGPFVLHQTSCYRLGLRASAITA